MEEEFEDTKGLIRIL